MQWIAYICITWWADSLITVFLASGLLSAGPMHSIPTSKSFLLKIIYVLCIREFPHANLTLY